MSAALRSLLLPLTPVYRFGLALRERRLATGGEPIRRLRFPVISIGNLSTGGSGKTPLTITLAQALTARGIAADVLSRGYGRCSTVPARVDSAGSADNYGDEPLLIARAADVPVYVAPQRYDAGLLAEQSEGTKGTCFSPYTSPQGVNGAEAPEGVHLLDDGFQHRQLHRDLDILLLNRVDLNDRLLPAGNLREALYAANRADVLAIPSADPILESDLRARGLTQPIWRLQRHMEIPPEITCSRILAFCGIALSNQFFSGLEQAGLTLVTRIAFRDHHRYSTRDLQTLAVKARAAGATTLLTTEKDAIRLRGLDSQLPIATVGLKTEIQSESAALDWLIASLKQINQLGEPR